MIPRDSHVLQPDEIRRLTRQSAKVLARLELGAATRKQLGELVTNPTARISDLRKAGYDVKCDEKRNGESIYWLANSKKTKDVLRASEPHASSERQDLREVRNETASSDVHDLNSWGLR